MNRSRKRLKFSNIPPISGDISPPPAAAPPVNAATPDRRSGAVAAGGGFNPPRASGGGDWKRFSVLLLGIDKKSACKHAMRKAVEECISSNFSFSPRAKVPIVERVKFCSHPSGGDDQAVIVVFHSRPMAEMLVEMHEAKGVDFPFAAPGKRVTMELIYIDSVDREPAKELLKHATVHVSGINKEWADSGKLLHRFEEIVFDPTLVISVLLLPGGAALVGLTSEVAVSVLMYRCAQNSFWLKPLGGDHVVMVSSRAGAEDAEDPACSPPPPTLPADPQKRDFPDVPRSAPAPVLDPAPTPALDSAPAPAAAPAPALDPPAPTPAPAPAPVLASDVDRNEKSGSCGSSPMDVDKNPGGHSGSSGEPLAGVEQRSLSLCFCDLEELITGALEKAAGVSEDRSFRLVIDINSGWPQLIFSSPAAADSLMSFYMSDPEKLHLEDFPFAISRHKLYSRPGASYRQHLAFTRPMKLMLSGLWGLRVHERLLMGAVTEAVERLLGSTGTLVRGSPALENLILYPGADAAVISLEETIAKTLLSITNTIPLSGRRLKVAEPGLGQCTLNIHNIEGNYSPTALRSIILFVLQKHHPDLTTDGCISELSWPVDGTKGYLLFNSMEACDALMDAYVAHTEDFCKQELVFTIYRHRSYIRPGTVFNRDPPTGIPPATRQLVVQGIHDSLDPRSLRGALYELVGRAVAGAGVLKLQHGMLKHFFYCKGKKTAQLTVDETLAKELVERTGLMLAGQVLKFIDTPAQVVNQPFVPPAGGYPAPALAPVLAPQDVNHLFVSPAGGFPAPALAPALPQAGIHPFAGGFPAPTPGASFYPIWNPSVLPPGSLFPVWGSPPLPPGAPLPGTNGGMMNWYGL